MDIISTLSLHSDGAAPSVTRSRRTYGSEEAAAAVLTEEVASSTAAGAHVRATPQGGVIITGEGYVLSHTLAA